MNQPLQIRPGFIIGAKPIHPPPYPTKRWYWFQTGITPRIEDAEIFPTRAEAFATWNDHAANFPTWEAEILPASEVRA